MSDLFVVEFLPLDFAALENIRSESLQDSFLLKNKAQRFHMSDEAALPVADGDKRFGEFFGTPNESGPLFELMKIHSPHFLRRMGGYSPHA
jgi:hypothetical protein